MVLLTFILHPPETFGDFGISPFLTINYNDVVSWWRRFHFTNELDRWKPTNLKRRGVETKYEAWSHSEICFNCGFLVPLLKAISVSLLAKFRDLSIHAPHFIPEISQLSPWQQNPWAKRPWKSQTGHRRPPWSRISSPNEAFVFSIAKFI